jgi:glycerol-3-phosphate acyltransferase PlsY
MGSHGPLVYPPAMVWLILIIVAYIAGSIPFGLLIGRMRGIDIRQHGSKNIGATNVGRVLGRKWGMLCFILDAAKGAVPVLVAGAMTGVLGRSLPETTQAELWLWIGVAAAAVIGHMASVFIGLKGGKGVATAFGALVAMWPLLTIPSLVAIVVWYTALRLTKYVSIASMAAAVSLPIGSALAAVPPDTRNVGEALAHALPLLVVTTALALLVIYRHRGNIARLRRGEEPKHGSRP